MIGLSGSVEGSTDSPSRVGGVSRFPTLPARSYDLPSSKAAPGASKRPPPVRTNSAILAA